MQSNTSLFARNPPPDAEEFYRALLADGPGRLHIVSSLIDRGADINGLYRQYEPHRGQRKGGGSMKPISIVTPLYHAAKWGDLEAVQMLIDRGADVNKRNRTATGLHIMLDSDVAARGQDTLSALDGMRMSRNIAIRELAEHLFGFEALEETQKKSREILGPINDRCCRTLAPRTDAEEFELLGPRGYNKMKKRKKTEKATAANKQKKWEKKMQAEEDELDRLRRERKERELESGERRYDMRLRK
ncbi:hypothetical protein K469DRAFT_702302 [Zopfia rhizophila CBS 207.26]|uniref:Uncharacterized protein n=1 Tax=Zopfia rhizophila CBS 207.26 TaxID=1314779 RepID=A0A6A6DB13_9PEZI|nr:hypothetical protein K469DRAFT_702302 [Zopfia rhizophila CBS 207.26]